MPTDIVNQFSKEKGLKGSKKFQSSNKKHEKVDHPATSDVIYDDDAIEFMMAVAAWRAKTGRIYPSYSEILGIAKGIGYSKTLSTMGPETRPEPPRTTRKSD